MYFFRQSCIWLDDNSQVFTCYASMKIPELSVDIFLSGFLYACYSFGMDKNDCCAIEEISHNVEILKELKQKCEPIITTPMAYFFYNYIEHTTPCNKVFIIT